MGQYGFPGHRAGAAPGDDRQLPRGARLEERAPAPRHQARPFARRLHRRMAGVRVVAAALCAAACARDDARVLHFWAMGREGEVASELLGAFERENPGLRVRVEQLPFTAAHEKLLTAYAGDATPDIAQMGNTWLPEFVALDAVVPLDDRLRASTQVDLADFDPGIVATNVIEGRQYGVPWYVDTRVLFYRRDLLSQAGFDAPPRDWDEWLRMQVAVKQRVGPDRYAVLLPLNEYEQLVALWLQQGEPLLRDGNRFGNFRSAGFAHALEFYLSMFERHLVEFLSRPAVQQEFYRLSGNLPARRSAWAAPALAHDPYARAFRDQLDRVRPIPQVPEWERIATELRLVMEMVVRGDIPKARVAQEMDARADLILEKRRWMLERRAHR